MHKTYKFKGLITKDGWLNPAYVSIDKEGKIVAVRAEKPEDSLIENVNGYALPGFQNAHSHAFQYAMAGMAEVHSQSAMQDDFWSWREAMYQLALSVSPDRMQAIATMLYAEMLRHGYTHVAEFHYVHHDPSGKPYTNLAEMGERLIAAAKQTGIRITLIPIFYQKGGFGLPANKRQRRFISPDMDAYLKLWQASERSTKAYNRAHIGIGVHSLRAVEPELIPALLDHFPEGMPFHIHVSEQLKEIADSKAYLGMRPVEWILRHLPTDRNIQLVHATHMTETETKELARTNAQVVLCPSTEGNLGDGLFPLRDFQKHGGQWSIGTDSHIGLNPLEELRMLDYGQRIHSHRRDTFVSETQRDSGFAAMDMAWQSGRRAMGLQGGAYFAVGQEFDALLVDADAPVLAMASPEYLLSAIVYAADSSMFLGTMVQGEWVSRG